MAKGSRNDLVGFAVDLEHRAGRNRAGEMERIDERRNKIEIGARGRIGL